MNPKVWEDFLVKNQISKDLPEYIVKSWQRSIRAGIRTDVMKAPQVLTSKEIKSYTSHHLLYYIFSQFHEKIEKYFNLNDFSLNLADREGQIISSFVKGDLKETLKEVHFYNGGLWNESAVGTNAIGTALAADREVVIRASQHFCETWHPFSCAAVPVRHPVYKTTEAVLDLTSMNNTFPENALGLTSVLVQSLESAWHAEILQDNQKLKEAFKTYIQGVKEDIVIVVDRSKYVIDRNDYASPMEDGVVTFLDIENVDNKVFEGRIQAGKDSFVDGRILPVKRNGRTAGVIIHLPREQSKYRRRGNQSAPSAFDRLIGESEKWRTVIENARVVSTHNVPVLITGESGTGKELLAQAIHDESSRKEEPFVAINCATLHPDLAASELFGYTSGAFTGALKGGKRGLFEAADGGTLFLDEISEMPLSIQAMLLRVLQEQEVTRIGEHSRRSINVRIIAASNLNIKEQIYKGRFRADLFYRLNVARLTVPSIRDRKSDIPHLVQFFLKEKGSSLSVNQQALYALLQYNWPGNVRELKNAIEYASLYAKGYEIYESDFPDEIREESHQPFSQEDDAWIEQRNDVAPERGEKHQIIEAIKASRHNMSEAAKVLGVSRSTLYRRLKKYQIEV